MPESGGRIPEDSPTYREFTRLYGLARQLRPTGVDRWNRELYATNDLGSFDRQTGAIRIHEPLLREGLTSHPTANPQRQARALATVLSRVTQAGMEVDASGEANAVRTTESRGLNNGVASVRAATDFEAFGRMAGYPRLAFDHTHQFGAYAAANGLIQQASGPSVDRADLINRLSQGPAMMHFDQVAEAVVRNRLQEVAPPEGVDRQGVRRELIATMLHPQWDSLARRSPEAGQHVAGEIGRALNAKVEEIRRRGPHPALRPETGDVPRRSVERTTGEVGRLDKQTEEVSAARFLSGVAPASGAAGQTPSLGDGSRAAAAQAAARAAVAQRSHRPGGSGRG